MRRTLSSLAILSSFGLLAQEAINFPAATEPAKTTNYGYTGEEAHTFTPIKHNKAGAPALDIIGTTYYDLQSNASVDDRISYNPSTGEISAAFTMSLVPGPAFGDRGTGYNFYDGTSWGTNPSTRIENQRVGWPSLVTTDTSEFVVAHSADDLVSSVRDSKGSGSWSTSILSSVVDGMLWPRATMGGTDGKTVHVIAITTPTGNSGNIYKGLNGALLYYRSMDGGFTWDIKDSLLPGQDTAVHFGTSGDSYAIDANGNTIAIAVFNDFQDSYILKSTDNGDTWNKTVFFDIPLDDYSAGANGTISDTNSDGIADTIFSTDQSGAILVDNNNVVHVAYGYMRYIDDDPILDAPFSYFPFTNGLDYWNENMSSSTTIGFAPDLDNDGTFPFGGIAEIGNYQASMSSQPALGVDVNNNIFCTYAAVNELKTNGIQYYRDIWLVSSRNGGMSWNSPKNLTPNRPIAECVFPSLAHHVDSNLRIVYQEDNEPGLTVRGDEDPDGPNNIIYLEIDTAATQFVSISEETVEKGNLSGLYPNPASTTAWMDISINEPGKYTISISNITGVVVKTIDLGNLGSGAFKEAIDLNELDNGVYVVTLRSENYSSSKKLVIRK